MRSLRLAIKQSLEDCVPPINHSDNEPPHCGRPKRVAAAVLSKKNSRVDGQTPSSKKRKRQAASSSAAPPPPPSNDDDGSPSKRKKAATRRPRIQPPPGQTIQYVRNRRICSSIGCTKFSINHGLCTSHGATPNPKKKCSVVGCTNISIIGGICVRHGAKLKKCGAPGCTTKIVNNGVCKLHGAAFKYCEVDGCRNKSISRGVCKRHGAPTKGYYCVVPGCSRHAVSGSSRTEKGPVCCTHGGTPTRRTCSFEGCTKSRVSKGLCHRHGAPIRMCDDDGCTLQAVRGGVCLHHGARKIPKKIRGKKRTKIELEPESSESLSEWESLGSDSKVKPEEQPATKRLGRGSSTKIAKRAERGPTKRQDTGRCTSRKKEPELDSKSEEPVQSGSKTKDLPNKKGRSQPRKAAEKKHESEESKQEKEEPTPRRRSVRHRMATANARGVKINTDSDSDSDDDKSIVSKSYSTERPTRETLRWIRSMSDEDQRSNAASGMRVKVRFEDNVWYGGTIDRVVKKGSQIKISFDDGSQEMSDFPDKDIVVDDVKNKMHCVDAKAFVPHDDSEDNESSTDDLDDYSPPTNVVSSMVASYQEGHAELICHPCQSNSLVAENEISRNNSNETYDSDEEEELGAFIYRTSLMAQSVAEQNGSSDGGNDHNVEQPMAVTRMQVPTHEK